MKFLKLLLAAIGVIAVVVGAFWLVGVIASILWGLVWIALLGAVGYGGYKLLLGKSSPAPELSEKKTVVIADLTDTDKALDEYKRRLLHK